MKIYEVFYCALCVLSGSRPVCSAGSWSRGHDLTALNRHNIGSSFQVVGSFFPQVNVQAPQST
jgi:hypothetical protein